MKGTIAAIGLLLFACLAGAQTPPAPTQMECRPLDGDNFVGPNEMLIKSGDSTYQVCHPVTKAVTVTPQPAVVPQQTAVPPQAPPQAVAPVPQQQTPVAAPQAAPAQAPEPMPNDGKIRVYVTDRPVSEVIGMIKSASYYHAEANRYSASANGGSATNGVLNDQKGAADHRTIEVSDDIVKYCHNANLVITQNPSTANYILDFRRQGGRRSTMFAMGGLAGLALSASMKVDGAGLYLQNGDMVKSAKARSVDGVIKELCGSMQ